MDNESYIQVKFSEYGSAIFAEPPQFVNVHPLQMLALAEFMRVTANAAILEMREASKIQIPTKSAEGILKP